MKKTPKAKHQHQNKEGKRLASPPPKFSFVVPVLNGEKTIGPTLSSLIGQKHSSFEIIVVDNASSDATKRVVCAFSGLSFIYCEKKGRSHARNLGARLARGEYLAFVDADVTLAPDWLEQVERYLKKIPLDAIATKVTPMAENDSALDRYRAHFAHWKSRGSFLSARSRTGAYPLINTAACVVKRTSFERVGGFDEALLRHEDLDLSFRLFAKGFLLGGVSAAKAKVRFSADRAFPLAREIAYIRRAFEVQSQSLFLGRKPIYLELLREIATRSRCAKTALYALLVEAAWQVGSLSRQFHRPPYRRYAPTPGRAALLTTFRHDNKSYFLKPGMNLIFIDSSVFLCLGPWMTHRLSQRAAKALTHLCAGLEVDEIVPLLRSKAFQPIKSQSRTGGNARDLASNARAARPNGRCVRLDTKCK